jgi:uncharacterized protein involved in exopolysaccharide biosynthesis
MTLSDASSGHTSRSRQDSWPEALQRLRAGWLVVVGSTVLTTLVALVVAFVWPPSYTARTVFVPPQQQQSAASSALMSLSALGMSGLGALSRTPADQYVSLMKSETVRDQLVQAFDLMKVYESRFRMDARRELDDNTRITVGKRDGLVSVEVDDRSPERAAAIANAYVESLRKLSASLLLTEAQQRRAFFDKQLNTTRERLTAAQQALQASGFDAAALRAEPRSAADTYARLRAELTSAEIRLQSLRRSLVDGTPEVQQQISTVGMLRQQLTQIEANSQVPKERADYVARYRDFKYQETLFDMLSRQYEAARLDESQEGALIQVVDLATVPERRSKPRRTFVVLAGAVLGLLGSIAWLLLRSRPLRDSARSGPPARA